MKQVDEQDLLRDFGKIQEQMEQLAKERRIKKRTGSASDLDPTPLVQEAIFSYEVHVSR